MKTTQHSTMFSRRSFLTWMSGCAAATALAGCEQKKAVTQEKGKYAMANLDKLTKEWWECPGLKAAGKVVWDDEVKAVNAMTKNIGEIPEWALQVRSAMPKYGFEMCSHRWLDGLDDVIQMIGEEEFRPSTAGHCGDIPGRVVNAAGQRAAAVQQWLDRKTRKDNALDQQVAKQLGKTTPEKKEAAACFVEMVRAYFFMTQKPGTEETKALAKQWRSRADRNPTLKVMFEGEGLDGLLENRCGFKVIDRLDLYIRIIGGNRSRAGERHGGCIAQTRFTFRDDPARFDTTRGILCGLDAYLRNRDDTWLRANKPDCVGAAIHARQGVSQPGTPTPLRRWLVASFLKTGKLWCQCVVNRIGKDKAPAYALDLPNVKEAIQT